MRDTAVTLQGQTASFWHFQQDGSSAELQQPKGKTTGSRKEGWRRKTDGERMERTGKWHSPWDVETRGKCTKLQTASIQKPQGTCTGKVRDKKCQRAEFSLAQPPSIISNSMFPCSACKDGHALLRPHMLLCVISACNDVCLSILQVSDSLAEWRIRKAVGKL